VVGDNKGAVFGGLVGTLETINKENIPGANRYFTLCSTVYLALGGGSHFALFLDSDLFIVKALVDCVMGAKRLMANYGVNVLLIKIV
ncbi:hypothetical protein Tco_0040064, partial [Tanacetum coccineum]